MIESMKKYYPFRVFVLSCFRGEIE